MLRIKRENFVQWNFEILEKLVRLSVFEYICSVYKDSRQLLSFERREKSDGPNTYSALIHTVQGTYKTYCEYINTEYVLWKLYRSLINEGILCATLLKSDGTIYLQYSG
jgi:hypothetical protein